MIILWLWLLTVAVVILAWRAITDNPLRRLVRLIQTLIDKEAEMAGELDALKTEVAQNTDVINSAILLLQGLKKQLDDAIAAEDPAALKALSDQLDASTNALAAAVAANTVPPPPTP